MLRFTPRLPEALTRLAFRLRFCGRRLGVEVLPAQTTYTLRDGAPLQIVHYGEEVTVASESPVTREIPPLPILEPPTQPRGREPVRRRATLAR
jgi:alpha,alpha-trehalose phosphorylase